MPQQLKAVAVERHGIEPVPSTERYGTPWRLFSIWFNVNLSLLCLSAGTLGILAGLPLGWTLLALVVGNAIGTVFMAAHSAQGPHLGIPQMIQSRAQFGVVGAALPLLAVVIEATLYTSANGVIVRDTLKELLPLSDYAALVLFGMLTLLVAFAGYELIHKLGATLSFISGAFFVAIAVLLFTHSPSAGMVNIPQRHFTLAPFILTLTQATAWNLSSAPYVADYSRYLPPTVSSWKTFWYTGLGNFLSATLIMALGAYLALTLPRLADHPGQGLVELFGAGRYLVGPLIVAGLLEVNVMNLYSAYMSSVAIFSGVRGMGRISLVAKFFVMLALVAIATAVAAAAQDNFNVYFADLLALLVYVLIPWSAINLADYYFVRKGRYHIDQMFLLDGIYGRYQWSSIGVYALGVIVQLPFIQVSFYTGSLARWIGADVAWLPGLTLPTMLYCLLARPEPAAAARAASPQESRG